MTSATDEVRPEGFQRVARALADCGHTHAPLWLEIPARTSQEAADALGVQVGQIAKSVIFRRKSDDAVVLVAGKVNIRDDRVSLIANELVVPDFSNAQVDRPLAVSLPTRQCTIEKVSALKQVLANHPGTSQVHLRLMSGDRKSVV